MIIIDGHCDTITTLMEKGEFLYKNNIHISIEKLKTFDNFVQFFAIWINDKYLESPLSHTIKAIDFFKNEVRINRDYIGIAYTYKDILNNLKRNIISGIITLEGGEILEGNIENLHMMYQLGVRGVTLTWNRKNQLGCTSADCSGGGLTDFGKEVVKEMNYLGMIVDVSHLSKGGFWDVVDISKKPFVASHSNSQTICNHVRNLDDEQIKAIAKHGGLVGINLFPNFLDKTKKATVSTILKHIDYIMNITGENNIALGGDLDGIDILPNGFTDVTSYSLLYNEIVKIYSNKIADKIFSENYLNFLEKILK